MVGGVCVLLLCLLATCCLYVFAIFSAFIAFFSLNERQKDTLIFRVFVTMYKITVHMKGTTDSLTDWLWLTSSQLCGQWTASCAWVPPRTPPSSATLTAQWSVRCLHGAPGDPAPMRTARTRRQKKVWVLPLQTHSVEGKHKYSYTSDFAKSANFTLVWICSFTFSRRLSEEVLDSISTRCPLMYTHTIIIWLVSKNTVKLQSKHSFSKDYCVHACTTGTGWWFRHVFCEFLLWYRYQYLILVSYQYPQS